MLSMFVDFMEAYDSVIRSKLWRVMDEFGILNQLILLVKITLKYANSRVRIRNKLSESFEINKGLRQGVPLVTLHLILPSEQQCDNHRHGYHQHHFHQLSSTATFRKQSGYNGKKYGRS